MKDFFAFRRMMTPIIIEAVFWIGVIACVVGGLKSVFDSDSSSMKIGGLAALILGPIVVRIVCELLILFFRMNETLSDIADSLMRANSPIAAAEIGNTESFAKSSEPESVKRAGEVRPPVPQFKTKEEYEKWKAERIKQNEDKEKS